MVKTTIAMIKYLLLLCPLSILAQGYTSFFTGNPNNITTNTTAGVCLMGGASENDNAMKWLLQKANGGDVVVIRSTGSNGYNNYLYTTLGISVNSVETLVITSAEGATNPYVLNKVANAEMIWFAGGNQFQYVSYFKDNALETILNNHINVKNAPIGGTSAGMAILCGRYFSAQNGSITSANALANPFNTAITLGQNDFLDVPFLQNTTTDTHFDNPDRRGRLMTFLARNAAAQNQRSFGIACNEYTAVCIDATGKAQVFGDFPSYPEYAYFIQANCQAEFLPETMLANTPLTWNRNAQAVKAYKVAGTQQGSNFFQLSDWTTGQGGTWENWSVSNGIFSTTAATPNNCVLLNIKNRNETVINIFPNPVIDFFKIENINKATITIFDAVGRKVFEKYFEEEIYVNTQNFERGLYLILIETDGKIISRKIIKT